MTIKYNAATTVVSLVLAVAVIYLFSIQEIKSLEIFDTSNENSISIKADKRAILVTNKGGPNKDRLVVCAEPSPDALSTLSSHLLTSGSLSEDAKSEISVNIQEMAKNIGVRTATIQLLRDTTYRACEAFMNGAINEFEYSLIINHYDRMMASLLTLEGLLNQNGNKNETSNETSKYLINYLNDLLSEPRLITSCLAWFSKEENKFDPVNNPRHKKFEELCDHTAKSYEGVVSLKLELAKNKIKK